MRTKKKLYPMVHPLKPVSFGSELPNMVYGEGMYLQDTHGKRYIDGISGLWNVPLGYGNPQIREAIINQLDEIAYVNPIQHSNPTTLKLAEMLLEILPDHLVNIMYTCSGSESNELAIKIARRYNRFKGRPNKNIIATLDSSYHGTYYGSMTASGVDKDQSESYGPKVPGFRFLPTPFCSCKRNGYSSCDCLDTKIMELEDIFKGDGENIAAIIIEPILGSGGSIQIPHEYFSKINELCDMYDVLLIIDEVATGFGRTGTMFAFEEYDILPDMVCLAKGINNGYLPLAATAISERIYNKFCDENSHVEHLSTQNGNPLACAAGIATINILKDKKLFKKVNEMGLYLKERIYEEMKSHRNFSEIRGKGLMLGVELMTSDGNCLSSEQVLEIVNKLTKKGLIIFPFINPPYTTGFHLFPCYLISEEDVRNIVNIIKRVFDRMILR